MTKAVTVDLFKALKGRDYGVLVDGVYFIRFSGGIDEDAKHPDDIAMTLCDDELMTMLSVSELENAIKLETPGVYKVADVELEFFSLTPLELCAEPKTVDLFKALKGRDYGVMVDGFYFIPSPEGIDEDAKHPDDIAMTLHGDSFVVTLSVSDLENSIPLEPAGKYKVADALLEFFTPSGAVIVF